MGGTIFDPIDGPLGFISKATGLTALLKVFGIETHNEVFTDLQISNLLTPGEADKSARRTSKHTSKGNAMTYFKGYKGFQRDYRKKYSAQFMERQGYAPNSTATAIIATMAKTKAYLQTLYGYANVSVLSFGDRYLTLLEKGIHAVQQIIGYEFATGQIVVSGKRYNNHQYLELVDDTKLQVTSTRLYHETIVQNLTDNYGYDGTHIYIGDNKYSVGPISNVININDKYETVCTHIPHQYANVVASALVNGTNPATISYPDDVDMDGFVEDYEIVGGVVNILVTLPGGTVVGNSLSVTINSVVTNYTVTQLMIDNGLVVPYSDYTLVNMPTLPNVVVLTPVEIIVNVVTRAAYGTEASYASYTVLSGEVGTETRYWVDVANTQNIYDTTVLAITAIIPMKENNVMVDTKAYKLARMLRKLNLSGDQLKTSIENPDMDAAYLMMGINPQYNDAITNEVLFKMFDYISPGSGNINIALSQLSMVYRFTMVKSTVPGVIGIPGTYTRSQSGSGSGVVMTLRFQGDANEYQQLVISGFSQNYTISGYSFTAYLDSTGGYCRLAIPLDLLNSLPYKKFVWIYERSLCMLAYSMEVVEVRWYETGAFGTILKIVGLVLTIWTLGAASSVYAFVVALAKVVVIGLIVSYIAIQIGGVAGALIGVLVGTLLAGGFSFSDLSTLANPELWLKMANQFINTMSQMQQHELESLISKSIEELTALAEQTEELQGKLEESSSNLPMSVFNSSYAGTRNDIFQSIEEYCGSLIVADVSDIVRYDLQMAYAISARSTVWVGP